MFVNSSSQLLNSTSSDSLTLIGPIIGQYLGHRDLNHLKTIFISFSILFKINERLSPQKNSVLSSTKLHILDFSVNKKISLMKILKT